MSLSSDILTIGELTDYLGLPESALYELAQAGDLPGKKVDNDWQFNRVKVDQWLTNNGEDHNAGSEIQSGQIECGDVLEHVELVAGAWDIELQQISKGKFHGIVDYAITPSMNFYHERLLRQGLGTGTSPKDFFMIGSNVAWQRSQIDWCGETINQKNLACASPGTEFNYHTPLNSHVAVMLVPPQVLELALDKKILELLYEPGRRTIAMANGAQLITTLIEMVQKIRSNNKQLASLLSARVVESTLLETLGNCLDREPYKEKANPMQNTKIFSAIEYATSMDGQMTTLELAAMVEVSMRTLEYHFKKVFEMTPSIFLHRLRLNAVHRKLLQADPSLVTVSELASKYGFMHPGRFSLLYRELFGEKPSETLRRSYRQDDIL